MRIIFKKEEQRNAEMAAKIINLERKLCRELEINELDDPTIYRCKKCLKQYKVTQ